MNKNLIIQFILLSFLGSQVCYAQTHDMFMHNYAQTFNISPNLNKKTTELPQSEKDPGSVLSPLRKGQKAPFTGILLSPSSVAYIIVEMETFQEKINFEISRAVKINQTECERNASNSEARTTADKKELQAQINENNRKINILNEQLKKEKKSQTNPGLWLGLGVAGGVVLTVLTTFAVSQATK